MNDGLFIDVDIEYRIVDQNGVIWTVKRTKGSNYILATSCSRELPSGVTLCNTVRVQIRKGSLFLAQHYEEVKRRIKEFAERNKDVYQY